jgi:hypothetical protein
LANRAAVILALCYVTCPVASVIAGDPETGVTSETDAAPAAETVQEGVGGRVTSASGAPLADVFVQAHSPGGQRPVPDLAIITDADGRFFWKLAPGSYELSFMRDGRELARRRVMVHPNRTTRLDVE